MINTAAHVLVARRPGHASPLARLDDADRQVQAHASAGGARRLALLLIYLSELSEQYERSSVEDGIEIRPPLSQEELGSWVDASRETVARALKEWRRLGLLRTGRRKIIVLDPLGLHAYARGISASRAGGTTRGAAKDDARSFVREMYLTRLHP